MLVVEIDHVDPEPFQRRVACRANVLRPSVDTDPTAVRSPFVAELGREHDAVTPVCDRAADELLVVPYAVHVGGIDEGDAELDRPVDRLDRLSLVLRTVEL